MSMTIKLFVALAFATFFSSTLFAKDLFKDCEDISNDKSYRQLNAYFSANQVEREYCLRLNSKEFLFTTAENLMYCHLVNSKFLTCEADISSYWYPNFSMVKQFAGANSKQFVLFQTGRLSHGLYSKGYQVFFLAPKEAYPRGYRLFSFPKAGIVDNNDGSGTCADKSDFEVVQGLNPPIEILNENKINVAVRFNQLRIDCQTGKSAKQTLEYSWKENGFQETKNEIEVLQVSH